MKSTLRLSETPWYEYLIIGLFICLVLYVGINLCVYTGFEFYFDKDYIDGYGSLVGGVGTVVGIYYLYKTLKSQNESQQLSSFENRYIQLVTFHRDMVTSIEIDNTSEHFDVKTKGRALFSLVLTMVDEARDLVKELIKDKDIKDLYKDENAFEQDCVIWSVDNLRHRTEINIAYMITFVGVSSINAQLLTSVLKQHYTDEFTDQIIKRFKQILKGEKNEIARTNPLEVAKAIEKDEKKYSGVQDVLGNYFRLLYNTIGYLHEQKWIEAEDRYIYAKMIRSQMSDYEELLLFYNSVSDFGMDWEYNGHGDKKLITTYQLIKNIPIHIEEARKFYPQIKFEKQL